MSEDDPIPPSKIRLQDAYERVFRAMTLEWQELEAQTEEKLSKRKPEAGNVDDCRDLDEAHARTARFFQETLSAGALTAYREYPAGERQLSRKVWTVESGYSPGIVPGVFEPPAGRGPVYFSLPEFEKWLKAISPREKLSGGRPPTHDWDDIRDFVFETMDDKGDFDKGWKGWQGPADLHKLIYSYLERRKKPMPEKSALYNNVTPMITDWRNKQNSSAN